MGMLGSSSSFRGCLGDSSEAAASSVRRPARSLGGVAFRRALSEPPPTLLGEFAKSEDAGLDLGDRGVATVLLDHGGEPRAHRGFWGFTYVR